MSSYHILIFFLFLFFTNSLCAVKKSKTSHLSSKLHSSSKQTVVRPPHKVSLYFNSDYETMKSSAICQIPGDKIDRLYYGYLVFSGGTCKFSKANAETYLGPKSGVCGDTLQSLGSDQYYGDIYQLIKFKQKYPHVKVFLSLGGPFFSYAINLHNSMVLPPTMYQMVNSCVNLYKKYSTIFDGFDLDLEYSCPVGDTKCGPNGYYYPPSSDDKSALTSFITALKGQLGITPLSMMVPADTNKLPSINFQAIDSFIDHYNIQNYDLTAGNFGDTTSGFHTFLGPVLNDPVTTRNKGGFKSTYYLLGLNINPNKINMGSPFHGRGFKITPGTPDLTFGYMSATGGLPNAKYEVNVFDYNEIKSKYYKSTIDFFNMQAKASYLYDKANGLFITYESPRSAVEKIKFVKNYNLQGVFAWEFAGDTSDHELLRALNENPVA